MRRETFLFILGIGVFITPLLGVPYAWKDGVQFFLGTCVLLVALVYRMDARRRERTKAELSHEEHNPKIAAEHGTPEA